MKSFPINSSNKEAAKYHFCFKFRISATFFHRRHQFMLAPPSLTYPGTAFIVTNQYLLSCSSPPCLFSFRHSLSPSHCETLSGHHHGNLRHKPGESLSSYIGWRALARGVKKWRQILDPPFLGDANSRDCRIYSGVNPLNLVALTSNSTCNRERWRAAQATPLNQQRTPMSRLQKI